MMEPIRFGKFLLVEQIAAGGMAEIYRAIGVTVDGNPQSLAIKRILPQYSQDEEFVHLLIDEAKLMVFLNHPSIVPIIEFGKVEECYYIAMEYIEGTTLKGLYKRIRDQHQHFTIDTACHIVREIGGGLGYAHRKTDKDGKPLEIVHRDISPANILISYDGDIKIADFGISKAATQGHQTQVGVIRGKTGYMSPEQTRSGVPIDQRSDLYSLGIIFWEILTGERLYVANSVPEALQLIRKSQPPAPSSRRPQIPPALDAIVLRALSADPEVRYQKGEEMVDEINEFLGRFAPGGRPVRVTHTDLSGFLRRYYASEMDKALATSPVQLDQIITRIEAVPPDKDPLEGLEREQTKPETIAQNPLFELSLPEHVGAVEPPNTMPSGTTNEVTIPETTGSLAFAPRGFVKTVRKIPPLFWAIGVAAIVIVSLISMVVWRQQSGPKLPLGMALVSVVSQPEDAEILISGELWNEKTPAKVELPTSHYVEVTVRRAGYVSETQQIRALDGPMRPIRFTLKEDRRVAEVGKARIVTDPPGARVLLDGQELQGKSPLEISFALKKQVTVRVEVPGYRSKQANIRLDEPGRIEKVFVLAQIPPRVTPKPRKAPIKVGLPRPLGKEGSKKPIAVRPAKLSVATQNPAWSYVWIDGQKAFEAPFAGYIVEPGKHRITLSNEAFKAKPYSVLLTFKPGSNLRLCFDFKARKAGCR